MAIDFYELTTLVIFFIDYYGHICVYSSQDTGTLEYKSRKKEPPVQQVSHLLKQWFHFYSFPTFVMSKFTVTVSAYETLIILNCS